MRSKRGIFTHWLCGLGLLVMTVPALTQETLDISAEETIRIAMKVWQNESGGTVEGLTSWNTGEDFASVGIGHFIWFPAHKQSDGDSFPQLLKYMQARGAKIPHWLRSPLAPYCPWRSRSHFMREFSSPMMYELRRFLIDTIPWQAQFMVDRLKAALPRMLAAVPPHEQPYIRWQFHRLASTPQGIYALVDYVNFKGEGAGRSNFRQNWGLLQVLEEMQYAPTSWTPLQAFAWSADRVLTRRVQQAPAYKREDRWLLGWRKRIRTYVE